MSNPIKILNPAGNAATFRDALSGVREIVLGNIINAGETPSPTGDEEELALFIEDRFKECDLANISIDEAGNAAGLMPGSEENGRTILVAAHADKIWPTETNHTVTVSEKEMTGCGIADNSLGIGALISLPHVLQKLGIELKSDLLLIGTTKSFGRGDLAGMRFFLDHTKRTIAAGICLEGMQLGRLSFSSLGMLRGKIEVDIEEASPSGAIAFLAKIVTRILAIETPSVPKTDVLLGSIEAGSGYNVPPGKGSLRFEIRSEDAEIVARIHQQIEEIIDETDALGNADCTLHVLATRTPGDIGFNHPLVKSARDNLKNLDIEPRVEPSISELSVLLDHRIPSLTLGLTRGKNRHTVNESAEIDSIFTGLAQIIATLQFIDSADDETLTFPANDEPE